MEIFMLVLMYYLSQNPQFAESVKPLMGQLKNSEQMLSFLNDLSKFTQTFSSFSNTNASKEKQTSPNDHQEKQSERQTTQKNPQSPTSGIADDFIQNILETYLKKN